MVGDDEGTWEKDWGSGGEALEVEDGEVVKVVAGLPGEVLKVAGGFVEGGRIPEILGKLYEHKGIFVTVWGQEKDFVGADGEVGVWIKVDGAASEDGVNEIGWEVVVGLVGRLGDEKISIERGSHGEASFLDWECARLITL